MTATSTTSTWITVVCVATCALQAQTLAEPGDLVAQLATPQRQAAHQALVALRDKAVPALVKALEEARPALIEEVIAILGEIGADAGAAVPALLDRAVRDAAPGTAALLPLLGDLAPFRPANLSIGDMESIRMQIWLRLRGDLPDQQALQMCIRLRTRFDFPTDLKLPDLVAALRSHQPYRVEVAVELLGQRGSGAEAALPALQAVLQRRDPRVLMTERTLPLRAKAARAILLIAADGEAASEARAVLTGSAPPPATEPVVPERARARILELIAELHQAARRQAATVNLVALGTMVVAPLTATLADEHSGEFREAALQVLRELGPQASAAVGPLFELLPKWTAEHSASLVTTLTAIAPWCRDVLPAFSYSGGEGSIRIFGKQIRNMDAGLCDAFNVAGQYYMAVIQVDPGSTLPELQKQLDAKVVVTREAALRALRHRGAEARSLLPVIAEMLEHPQPRYEISGWMDGPTSSQDRTHVVHRLAAETILAIAAPGDPLLAKAREVLQRLPAQEPK